MKSRIVTLAALLASTCLYAQTEVTAGIMRGKDYGVTYILPKTEIELTIQATKRHYTPGDFCKYADRYLRLDKVSGEEQVSWTLDKVTTAIVGVPDKENVYFVKLKDKSVAPLMELTEDGIVRSINMPYSGKKKEAVTPQPAETDRPLDPRSFLTEEILMANSSAKMAELVAREIYSIRESKNALLRGEADSMPKDGEQLRLMLDNLNRQEQAMLEMFAGHTTTTSHTYTIRIVPKEMEQEVAFRFSELLGMVSNDDLAGEPVYISISDLKALNIPQSTEEENKKGIDGVAYNVPGRAQVKVTYERKTLYDGELPVTQFGTREYLAPVLFNKNTVTKVLFDVNTGGLLKVDRGE